MKQVDRGNYCSQNPYSDRPQSIGFGVTISAPHMVSTEQTSLMPSPPIIHSEVLISLCRPNQQSGHLQVLLFVLALSSSGKNTRVSFLWTSGARHY